MQLSKWVYEYHRSRSFVGFGQRSLRFNISNLFSLETARPIKATFPVEPPWYGGTKVCLNGLGHMTNIAVIPRYGKIIKKNLLLGNQKSDDLETWYATLGTWVLPSLFKRSPWVDFDLFYSKVKFGPLCSCKGKKVKQWIFRKLLYSMISSW